LFSKLLLFIYSAFLIRLVEGLTGQANTVSFESTSRPGYYLCLAGGKVIIVRMINNLQMQKDCTFTAWSDRFFDGYVSFELADQPDQWIRQDNRQLKVSMINTYRDNNDASFLLSETSYAPVPQTTQRPTTTTTTRTTTTITTTNTTTTTTKTTPRWQPVIEPCEQLP
jgi:hypothetical protein